MIAWLAGAVSATLDSFVLELSGARRMPHAGGTRFLREGVRAEQMGTADVVPFRVALYSGATFVASASIGFAATRAMCLHLYKWKRRLFPAAGVVLSALLYRRIPTIGKFPFSVGGRYCNDAGADLGESHFDSQNCV